MAISFEDAGAKRLHLVDLDGAFRGKGANMASIRSILKNISIPVQLGGGLRNAENIEQMFELGVSSVIVSTMAVKNSEVLEEIILRYSGKRIFLGVDARNRKVSIEGWQEGTEIDDVELPSELPNSTHAWHQYTIRVKDRMSLREYLASNGIGSGIYYPRLIQDYPHIFFCSF